MSVAVHNHTMRLLLLSAVACSAPDASSRTEERAVWSVLGWDDDSTVLLARLDLRANGAVWEVNCDSAGLFRVTIDGTIARRRTPNVSCAMLGEIAGLAKSPAGDVWLAGRGLRADGLALLRGRRRPRTWLARCSETRDPAWPAAGSTVVFVGSCQRRSGGEALYTAAYPNGDAAIVVGTEAPPRTLHAPSWSHDGSKLVYSRGAPGPGAEVMVAMLDGGNATRVAWRGHSPSWNSARDVVAYVLESTTTGSSIRLRTVGTDHDTLLVASEALGNITSRSQPVVLGPPRWSPGSRSLAFSTGDHVLVLDLETSRLALVAGRPFR